MSTPRRVWKPQRTDSVIRRTIEAFGWRVMQHVMPEGGRLVTVATQEVPRGKAPNLTLYVRGRATFTLPDGTQGEDRVPGMFSGDRPNTPAGESVQQAVEELEFWCFNWHANRGALPQVEILRLAKGDQFTASTGQRVLLCAGLLGDRAAGTSFIYDGVPLTAQEDCYGFLIGGDRV